MNEYTLKDIEIGMEAFFQTKITAEMENAFREITGDINPMHRDDRFASELWEGRYDRHVVFVMLTASFYSTLAGMYLPGKYSLIHSIEDLQFKIPVFVGDELKISGKVVGKEEELNLIIVKAEIKNQNGKCVSKAKIKVLVLRKGRLK